MKTLALTVTLLGAISYAQQRAIETVGTFRGIGGQLATIVAPGKTPGSERLYASFSYGTGANFDILSIDPDTGDAEVFHSPVSKENAAWNFAVGPKGNVFLGTSPSGHLLELDTKQRQFIDRGHTAESYIWDVAIGSDNRLYGATYPGCKLIRYDPSTERMEDLGKLDPTEQYARSIAASNDGFIYVGIGSSKANIAAYNIRTGEHREILPADAQLPAIAKVYRGQDGNIYGTVSGRHFRLNDWTATELKQAFAPATTSTLHDGRALALTESMGQLTLTVTDPKTNRKIARKISYQGQELPISRIGFGPDGVLYGSSAVPLYLLTIGKDIKEIANLGNGEAYSFLSHAQSLLIAAYAGLTTLMSFNGKITTTPFQGDNASWRPMAMINGHDGNVYVGSVGGYGLLEAPLLEWDGGASVQQFRVVQDQSIASLAAWRNFIVGGTSVSGGMGSRATQKDAQLFLWDTKTHTKVFSIPVPAPSITDLLAVNDRICGIANDSLFVFDPSARKIVSTQKLPFTKPIFNSVALGPDGRIWGLAEGGIFAIDIKRNTAELVKAAQITGGFAMKDGAIYFISNSTVYRYKI
jgi:hypothetical protein